MSFFVFQLAQAHTSIQFKTPHVRCIGFTENLDGARLLAKKAFDEKKMETRIMPSLKVFLAGKHKYVGLDLPQREREQQKANALVDLWIESRKESIAESEKEAKAKKILEDPVFKEKEEEAQFMIDDDIQVYDPGFFGVAIIPDEEPALIALGFDFKLENMQAKIKELSFNEDFKHFDMFIGETGKWMPLRNPKSLKVMHHNPLRQEIEGLLT